MDAFVHWCEVCGKEELLTTEEAYRAGWDYPPKMGAWGVISPRTCPACPMNRTLWWAVQMDGYDAKQLSPEQRQVAERITAEVPAGQGDPSPTTLDADSRDRLDLDDRGSWVVSTKSGSQYLLRLAGDERTVVRLAIDDGHTVLEGRTVMRRDGDELPLLGLVDPPIRVGRPAYLVVGNVTDDPGYVSTTRATTPVVAIRRAK